MRSSFWALISLALACSAGAQAPAVVRVEIEYELLRDGSRMAEVVEQLEYGNGAYRMTETSRGRGVYSLLGRAKRTSAGALGDGGPRPRG